MDTLPALMLIAADSRVRIILANQRAECMKTEAGTVAKRCKDHGS